MTLFISILFIIEFFLLLYYFLFTLFKKGLTFKLGLTFGVLYFIFIPVGVLLFTGHVPIVKTDFHATTLTDVSLKNDIKASITLILYILSFLFYLYFVKERSYRVKKFRKISNYFTPKIKLYLTLYIILQFLIISMSGLLKGGDWYTSRHLFMIRYGTIAVLSIFTLNALKILIIASFIYLWEIGKLSFLKFIIFVSGFTIFDMIISGNRIYFFVTFVIIALLILRKYPVKVLVGFPILAPIVYYLGYFGSIFRHIRGPLFHQGIPTYEVFKYTLKRAMILDPPNPISFLLNISESVNFNVFYNIINKSDKIRTLYGATYLKVFVFFIPRSIWNAKPESITKIAANYFGSASLVTTLFGELHMNFSYLGILLLPFILYMADYILAYFKMNNKMYDYILFIMGILIFRMPFSDEIITYLFLFIIVYFTVKKYVIKHSGSAKHS